MRLPQYNSSDSSDDVSMTVATVPVDVSNSVVGFSSSDTKRLSSLPGLDVNSECMEAFVLCIIVCT